MPHAPGMRTYELGFGTKRPDYNHADQAWTKEDEVRDSRR